MNQDGWPTTQLMLRMFSWCSLFLRSQNSNRWFNYTDMEGFLGRTRDCPAHTSPRRYLNSSLIGWTFTSATLLLDYTTATRRGRPQAGCHGKVLGVSCFPLKARSACTRRPPLAFCDFADPQSCWVLLNCSLNATGGSRWATRCPGRNARRGDRLGGSFKMPLGNAHETSAGLPFKACAASGSEVQPEVSTCEPVTLAIWRLWRGWRAECVPGKGEGRGGWI